MLDIIIVSINTGDFKNQHPLDITNFKLELFLSFFLSFFLSLWESEKNAYPKTGGFGLAGGDPKPSITLSLSLFFLSAHEIMQH